MKKVLKILIPALIVVLAIYFLLFHETSLSQDQKNTIKLFGYPSQFVITYLPRGEADNPQLVRSETWYYHNQQTKIAFLGGKFVYEEEFIFDEVGEETPLKPEDFDYFLNFDDMSAIFGIENIIPIDFFPVLYEEGEIATYLTDYAVFIIENDQLTYFQTLGIGGDSILDEIEIEPEGIVVNRAEESIDKEADTEDWKTWENIRLGIRVKYPPAWFLEDDDIVLSSYDTGYMEKDLELPKVRLKCDFNKYNDSYVEIVDKEDFLTGDVKISKGTAQDSFEDEGPGMGDGVMFLIEKEGIDTIALICFSYDEKFENDLVEVFKTIEFIQ
ncbi:hypothetical protein K0B04_04115 [Patescibacteria group bacterium]|nr:hypothetical protein [Patescibacteria group bacterium]